MTIYEEIGFEKGMEKGRQKVLNVSKNNIFDIFNLRFQKVPYLVKEYIDNCEDLDVLKQLFHQAILMNSIDEFD